MNVPNQNHCYPELLLVEGMTYIVPPSCASHAPDWSKEINKRPERFSSLHSISRVCACQGDFCCSNIYISKVNTNRHWLAGNINWLMELIGTDWLIGTKWRDGTCHRHLCYFTQTSLRSTLMAHEKHNHPQIQIQCS